MWGKVEADPYKQEGLAILSHYLIVEMYLRRCDFHDHTQLFHIKGGGVYNFVTG